MKKILSENQIQHLSFPDYDVLSMEIRLQTKEIRIDLDGGILSERALQFLGRGFLSFKNWQKIFIKRFSRNKWINTQDSLREICEFIYTDNSFILRGFGKSIGEWVEYTISKATVEAEFDDLG